MNMAYIKKQVVVFGTNSAAILAYYQLFEDDAVDVIGFTMDEDYIEDDYFLKLPLVSFKNVESVFPPSQYQMFIPIGYSRMNRLRAQKYVEAKKKGYTFISSIHRTVIVFPDVEIGENCLIGANSVIQPSAQIGNNVIIRENCHIGHHTQIHDHCFIAGHSNISGNIIIESYCFLGAGSIIKDGLIIRQGSLIGAGVTMLENSNKNDVYMNRSAQKLPFPSDKIQF